MMRIARRSLLTGVVGFAGAMLLPAATHRAAATRQLRLVAAPTRLPIVGQGHPETSVWAYNGEVPGPTLRFRQGERARILVENRLPQETTIHWHGVRVPNAMDGVPDVTQRPIPPGESFAYEFELPDAGTFWYHPHARSFEQVERGLAGALIVDEREPVAVDREIIWVLDDWRLTPQAAIAEDFGSFFDLSHAGRLGNTVTIDGRLPESVTVRAGERLRLRLVNVSNARIFGLTFEGHAPMIVALDGQPVAPHEAENGRVVLGPAMRIDLVLDMTGEPGRRYRVVDSFYRGRDYKLVDLAYADAPLRARPLTSPLRLPDNPLPVPDLARAERHSIELGGGMMDPKMMRGMREGGGPGGMMAGMMERMRQGHVWSINGASVRGHAHEPLLTLARGRSYVFDMLNDTAWHHPMHLHGLVFELIARNGRKLPRRTWQDTVLMDPGERVEIAFVADNPGDWMFHCHILEHQEAGMMGLVRVA